MNYLVTGGAGFIGSHLVEALIETGDDIRVLDDVSTGFVEYVHPKADFVKGSVADEDVVREAVNGIDVVFHQAAHRAVLRSVEHPLATDRANTLGTLTLLKAASEAGVGRVVYASSSSVYGGQDGTPWPETLPPAPRSPYAVTKLTGEHYCRVFAELYGIETLSLRYFNVYGPRQRADSAYAAVIPLFIEGLLHDRSPSVHGDGKQSRDFTYIDDVVAANLAAARAPAEACRGNPYNVAGGASHSLLDLLDILGGIIGVEPRPIHTDPRPGDVGHTRADITAARQDLGHMPRFDFTEGLRQTVDWFADDAIRPAV